MPRHRRPATVLALLALATSPRLAAAGPRRDLDPEYRKAVHSTHAIVNVPSNALRPIHSCKGLFAPIDAMYAGYDPPLAPQLVAGAFIPAVNEAWEEMKPLRAALEGYDPAPSAAEVVAREIEALDLFRGGTVELRREGGLVPRSALVMLRRERLLERQGVATLLRGQAADAVLVVSFEFLLSPKQDRIVVTAVAKLFANPEATSKIVKEFAKLTPSESTEPVPAMYRSLLYAVMTVPDGHGTNLERWAADGGAAARRAVDAGIAEVARLLAFDVEQGDAPKRRDPLLAKEKEADFDQDYVGWPPGLFSRWFTVREAEGRTWARQGDGALVSAGASNPALPERPAPPPEKKPE